ncbi:MAG: amidohydrolase family protein [Bacteroidota bacterium]
MPDVNLYKLRPELTAEEKAGEKEFWETYARACQILAKNLSAKGVKLLAGTDANLPPTAPGFSLHDELVSLQNAGMTPAQILRAATKDSADFMKSNTGQIKEGMAANLVLLDKNPLLDIRHTRTIRTVFANGKMFDTDLSA